MRTLPSIFLISIIIWGCSTQGNVKPGDGPGTLIIAPPDTVKKLTKDDSIHMVSFVIYRQKVKISVSGKKLILSYDENASLFLLDDANKRTSAIHLKEDFKKSSLAAFDFTTINFDGQSTFNSVDDNLNNTKFKTITDTTINSVKMVKVNVYKPFTFTKAFDSNQLATDQQKLLLGKTDDIITFSSYTYYNQKNYPVTMAVAYIDYVK
jgi:hypothetical protein